MSGTLSRGPLQAAVMRLISPDSRLMFSAAFCAALMKLSQLSQRYCFAAIPPGSRAELEIQISSR